ncbi:chromosomal replication initiator protein dnaA [Streptococcus pyogenes]|uniref:primosomal protein DnaI n=1 Tax=Streptococcus pyogenes TaxID=1314 RepID=UPI0010A1B7EE|nr:primosomal protein DnaI [Streptococcus pyogenes]VGU90666.1 chromosomal replication initiator protein dnaA [Streptococcus pyogenes]VGV30487.1 chromosomal replication initiator protein dnaA [Streptococcus pyogenes]VGW06447.1 chromosomal replication initiator protein dnaA [Streptococcus pyogenes]VHC77221.1 chromosomal replication initiator protein dnaA [Streptococcus pyogenes]
MEKIGETMAKLGQNTRVNSDQLIQTILADPEVVSFISQHHLSQEQINLSLSKFNQFLVERQKYQLKDPSYIAKGYQPILAMNEGYADVSYLETKELVEAQKQAAISERIQLVSLPNSYRHIHLSDIDVNNASRMEAFSAILDFVEQYPSAEQKGLYLYGDMGIGKSYLLAAMAHELSEKKGVSTTLLHFPSFAIDVKNAISNGSVKEEIDAVKNVPVLILDDIGAEQATSWVRDEVLQVILQYRMLEELPTFFTSNYSFADLERKWATIKGSDETWQAKRVMERVRYLAREFHLEGANRR